MFVLVGFGRLLLLFCWVSCRCCCCCCLRRVFFFFFFYFLSLYQCGWCRCRHRFHRMNTEGVTDLTDIQCRQATPLQLIKSSESCHEILYIEHILLAFFWLDWSKGAAFYSSVTEDGIRGCIFGLQLWLSEGGQHFWKVTIFSYVLGIFWIFYSTISRWASSWWRWR